MANNDALSLSLSLSLSAAAKKIKIPKIEEIIYPVQNISENSHTKILTPLNNSFFSAGALGPKIFLHHHIKFLAFSLDDFNC